MIENKIKQLHAKGKPIVNGWLSIANPFSAEIVASQGYDSVTIDMQHGIVDYADMVTMLQAMQSSGVVPVVRVPWLDPAAVMKAMDAGAYGIICPMVNNRAQAEELVSYMRYPPLGSRSSGPTRALFSAGADYGAHANDQMVCFAMIETAEAVENLEEIVKTPGLDGVYIGPSDLSIGYTNGRLPPGLDRQEPEMLEVIQRIQKAAADANIMSCLHCADPAYAAKAVDMGFDLVTLLNDVRMLQMAASANVNETRNLLAKSKT